MHVVPSRPDGIQITSIMVVEAVGFVGPFI